MTPRWKDRVRRLYRLAVLIVMSVSAANAGDLKVTTERHHQRVLHNRAASNAFPDQDWMRTETVYVHGRMRRFEYSGNRAVERGRAYWPTSPWLCSEDEEGCRHIDKRDELHRNLANNCHRIVPNTS
jgi:hypothetical protein